MNHWGDLPRQLNIENLFQRRVGRSCMVYNLEYTGKVQKVMLPDIEELVTRELAGLCPSCVHIEGCVFLKRSEKVVIQCTQFEVRASTATAQQLPGKGLCLNCDKAPLCHLPKETSGVWHCEEYE